MCIRDRINSALALIRSIGEFVKSRLVPDTELIARVYSDYFGIGVTPRRLLSFGLFKFGDKNEKILWPGGVLTEAGFASPHVKFINEDVTSSWFKKTGSDDLTPDPYKPGAYTWIKSVRYAGRHFQVGPLARMIITCLLYTSRCV